MLPAPSTGTSRRHPRGRILIAVVHESDGMTALIHYLTEERYDVRRTRSGADALRQVQAVRPDVVLLDSTPELNGLDVCRRLRQDPKTMTVGVIILTPHAEEGDAITAFAVGADDCVAQPFSPRELLARIAAVSRRGKVAGQRLKVGHLEIDRARFTVTMNGRPVDLTRKEFDLLETLAQAPGRVFGRRELLDRIWRPDGFVELEPRTVDVHVARLRRKFTAAQLPRPRIDTVCGVGYRFRDPDAN